MKKIFLVAIILSIVSLTIVLNIFKTQDGPQKEIISNSNSIKTFQLKFAHHMPKNSVVHKAAERFAKEIEKKTNSKVKITIFPNQEFGNSHQMLELSRLGHIDILLTATAKISVAMPSMQYADLAFLFPTQEDAYSLLDGKVGDMLLKDLNQIDLLGVTFWDGGYKNLTSNRPLTKLQDFKDLKVRVMKSRIIMEQFSALNAKPITIDFHATKQALSDEVVDAQENPLSEIVTMGFYKVQSDITLSNHSYLPYVLTFSKKSFSKLPLDIQNILIQTAKKITPWERQQIKNEDNKSLNIIKKEGLNVHYLSAADKQDLKDATSYIMKKYENILGSHIISKTQEYLYKKYNKEDVVVIGVDADLSMGAKGSGLAIKRGVELAVDDINKQGGLLSKKVVVIAKDHQGLSTQANENIKEFINDKNTLAVIGGKHSSIISSYIKDIQENKLIFISPWAAAPSVTQNGYKDNYIFRVSLNDSYATKFLTQVALKKYTNPAIVVENSIWGKEALHNINLHLMSRGLAKQEGIIINRGENKFENFFKNVKAKKHDSIIMVLNAQESKKIVRQMWANNLKIPIISHWGIVGDSFFEDSKNYLKEMDLSFIQTFSLKNNTKKEAQKLKNNYLKAYSTSSNEQINAITGVAQAYDAVMLLATAIKRCNTLDTSVVKNALENIDVYEGVLKKYKHPFSKTNHDALKTKDFFMAKFDKDGNIIAVVK
jgi:tripartite ATP-independent transporter DctP family solute receptor